MRRIVLLVVSAALAATGILTAQDGGMAEEATAALPLARVLPAAGSTPGSGGSFFKTSVQIYNPQSSTLSGRFVYHASGAAGSSADPGLNFSVGAQSTVSWDDILPAMGLSGLGTLDILLPSASNSPAVIVTRVYNDGGASGTSGFTQEAISPNENGSGGRVITNGNWGYLVLPSDFDQFRFNIGLRTLTSASSISFTVRDSDGDVVGIASTTMPAASFIQQKATDMLNHLALPPGGSIRIQVNGGSTIVYGATVDNTTQDASIQFARSGS